MAEPRLPGRLRALTPARLQLGRAGCGLPTSELLAFQLDHARARDAVQMPFVPAGLAKAICREVIEVRSQASDRAEYLRRPDLGRQLAAEDAVRLQPHEADLAIVIVDGLSAHAVHAHAASLVLELTDRLDNWKLAPIVTVRQGRVAIGDAIGERLGADLVCVLIGERPGLSAADSLGAYLTWNPVVGRRDSERNCISNIRPPHGLSYAAAADAIARLLRAARHRRLTGISLKDGIGVLPSHEP